MMLTAPKWQTAEQLQQLLCKLVSIQSVTGTQGELELARYVEGELQQLPYYQQHPDHVQLHPLEDGRKVVMALAKSRRPVRDTIILVSHYDVVTVQDYGPWQPLAFNPKALTQAYEASLTELPAEVRDDVRQGGWLFGRGTMDMKCGLAVHLSILERACEGAFDGNVLLLTVPDEEVNSSGMIAAIPQLLALAETHGLDYKLCINSEPMCTSYPGDTSAYVYSGSIGKVNPAFLCYGKETHVGESGTGLNANYMASEMTCAMELNSSLCQSRDGETTPSPTNLIQKDLKLTYSAQTPDRAVTMFNLFLFEDRMEELVQQLLGLAAGVAQRIEERHRAHHIRVLTYQQLYEHACRQFGTERIEALLAERLSERGGSDARGVTFELVDALSLLCKELSPMIVVFFAPPYYPAVYSGGDERVRSLMAMLGQESLQLGEERRPLQARAYYQLISDLSFTGLSAQVDELQPMLANMPLWGKGYSLPLDELRQLTMPVINIGPMGKDAHKWTERLYTPFAFGRLPQLLEKALQMTFAKG